MTTPLSQLDLALAHGFKGKAKRIDDLDLPRIAATIGVGEDELHAVLDVETSGTGFDPQGRPKILFEPHVFYRNLPVAKRAGAVHEGLASKSWGTLKYGLESAQYSKLVQAIRVDATAALKACSWGLGQVLGENHVAAGYATVEDMVIAMMADEENHLYAMVNFIAYNKLDDELRALARLTRKTTPDDCRAFVRGYNGPGYEKNNYHTKMAGSHNKWRAIRDTPWSPETALPTAPVAEPETVEVIEIVSPGPVVVEPVAPAEPQAPADPILSTETAIPVVSVGTPVATDVASPDSPNPPEPPMRGGVYFDLFDLFVRFWQRIR